MLCIILYRNYGDEVYSNWSKLGRNVDGFYYLNTSGITQVLFFWKFVGQKNSIIGVKLIFEID
jgi:hypothetical protein